MQSVSLGTLLRSHRKRQGLTQEELAQSAGISIRTVQEIEAGRVDSPRKDTTSRLLEVLSLSDLEHEKFKVAARNRKVALPVHDPYAAEHNVVDNNEVLQRSDRVYDLLEQLRENWGWTVALLGVVVIAYIALNFNIEIGTKKETDKEVKKERANIVILEKLVLSPMRVNEDGYPYVLTGELITGTFQLQVDKSSLAVDARIVLGGRGPDACQLDWDAQHSDFLYNDIRMPSGKTYAYEEQRAFDLPGVYFVEPVAKHNGFNSWNGIRPDRRIYFFVVDPVAREFPESECMEPFSIGENGTN